MPVLHPSWFASIVSSDKGNLEKISVYIGKYLGYEKKEAFNTACKELDFNKANKLIDEAIIVLSGNNTDSVSASLMKFISKFPEVESEIRNELLNAFSDAEIIKIIDRYYYELKQKIDSR